MNRLAVVACALPLISAWPAPVRGVLDRPALGAPGAPGAPAREWRGAPGSPQATEPGSGAEPRPILDHQVTAGGYRLRYLETGAGPAVVLLHGLGADVRTWRHAMPALAGHFRVIALDQLGFGRSEKPEIAYRVGTLADSLGDFLDQLEIRKVTLVGNSLGGWVAALFTARHPDRVDRLVLVDAAGYGQDPGALVRDYLAQRDPGALAMAERMLAGMTPEQRRAVEMLVAQYVAQRLPRSDGFALASLAQSIYRGEDALGPAIKAIRAPTLVVWGRNDRIVPLAVADAFASDIPDARKVVLDRCGHRPQTECAAAFNAELRRFLLPAAASQ